VSYSRVLPPRPSLDQQKKLAKELLKAFREDDPEAIARVRAVLPDKARIGLAEAQHVLAREYGFRNWAALVDQIRTAAPPSAASLHEQLRHAFDRRDLATIRTIVEESAEARRMLDAPVFPYDAPAIVHFAGAGDLEMVDLFLDLGADPNRRSQWWAGGFHALHSCRGSLAERLMERGAVPDACGAANLDRPDLLERILNEDPSRVHERGGDGQTPLHFARSRAVVDLLLDRGADIDARDLDHRATPAQWMLDQKRGAGRYALAEYLAARGATLDVFLAAALGRTRELSQILASDPGVVAVRTAEGEFGAKPPSAEHIYTWTIGAHLSPLQVAEQFGQHEAAVILRSVASPKERFIAACAAARREEAVALLEANAELLISLSPDEARVLPDAAWAGKTSAVALMVELGFDLGARGQDGGTALHCAAWQGWSACVDLILKDPRSMLLLEDTDPTHGSTPLGWCCHGARYARNFASDHPGVAELLLKAGARPGPNLSDAPEAVLAVIRRFTGGVS
jgi:ankyrin repeat protein